MFKPTLTPARYTAAIEAAAALFEVSARALTGSRGTAVRYGNHWVRESDLEGFVIPSARPRAGIPRGHQRLAAGPDRVVAGPPGNRRHLSATSQRGTR